jgi:hypothetical protein
VKDYSIIGNEQLAPGDEFLIKFHLDETSACAIDYDSLTVSIASNSSFLATNRDITGLNGSFCAGNFWTKNAFLIVVDPNAICSRQEIIVNIQENEITYWKDTVSIYLDVPNNPNCILAVENDEIEGNAYRIYPNPSDGLLTILSSKPGKYDLEVYDLQGRKLLKWDDNGQTTTRPLNLPAGIYILRIIDEYEVETHKVIIDE